MAPPSREIKEFDIENQQQSGLNSEHANANGCNESYALIRKHGARLQILVARVLSYISIQGIFLQAGHVENGLLDPEHLMGQREYGSILKLLQVLLIICTGVFTVLAQGPRLHCKHWWIPFSIVLMVSVAVTIATFCELKKISRNSRQVRLHSIHAL